MSENRREAGRTIRVNGGATLRGEVTVAGAKNAIGKQLVASLLTGEPCKFSRVPDISEITTILKMLSEVGADSKWESDDTLTIVSDRLKSASIGAEFSQTNRIPVLLLGPLLHRMKRVRVPVPGGCRIGPRPVNFHIDALERLGAKVDVDDEGFTATASELTGAVIDLPYPSVGATESILLSATLAKGTTVIRNAAVEPEIIDTIAFLVKMGASILVDVDRRIVIRGVEKLHGAHHTPIGDRIEAASYAIAAAATNGKVLVRGSRVEHMLSFLHHYRLIGGEFEATEDGIWFFRGVNELRPLQIETDVHPGFMTDWQQPFVVALTQARGISVIHETVYEDRFGYTSMLRNMGADISLSSECLGRKVCRFADRDHRHSALIRGKTQLVGNQIAIPDLRAGFAYLIAGLLAEGTTDISGCDYLDRGYANVVEKLACLGADISENYAGGSSSQVSALVSEI